MTDSSQSPELFGMPELSEYFEQASDTYRFLGNAYVRELTEEQISALAEADLSCPDDGSALSEGFMRLRSYLNRRGCSARKDLAVDYARIFLAAGVYEGDTAVPYESVFTSEEGILMQDARDDTVRAYRTYGMAVDPELNVPEDHLGFQLEFVSMMCGKVSALLREGQGSEAKAVMGDLADFVRFHLLNWVPALQERVAHYAEFAFYPAIVQITIACLEDTEQVLREALDVA